MFCAPDQKADQQAIDKFPTVKFNQSREDFTHFSGLMHRRIASSFNQSADGLKRLPPLLLEAAIHQTYRDLCAARQRIIDFNRETVLAREIMASRTIDLAALGGDFLGAIDWAKTRALYDYSEQELKYG